MAMSFDPLKSVAMPKAECHAFQLGAQRAVNDEVTGTNHRTADQLGVHFGVQPHLTLQPARERGNQCFLLFGVPKSWQP